MVFRLIRGLENRIHSYVPSKSRMTNKRKCESSKRLQMHAVKTSRSLHWHGYYATQK